jgi:hypothetical protein
VQQFFEALGLTTPPRIELSEEAVFFVGDPGDALEHTLQIVAKEKRPVYAHAVSDRPWLEVGRLQPGGRTANLRLVVASVPDRRGELLHAKLTITANGNQRFVVPVTLAVGGPLRGSRTEPDQHPVVVQPAEAVPVSPAVDVEPVDPPPPRRHSGFAALLPVLLVLFGLFVVMVHDLLGSRQRLRSASQLRTGEHLVLRFHDEDVDVLLGEGGVKPTGGGRQHADDKSAVWEPSMRFGLTLEGAPSGNGPKKLTFAQDGTTNNTCIRLDGHEWLFGERPFRVPGRRTAPGWPGRWLSRDERLGSDAHGNPRSGRRSVWVFDAQKVEVTQTVELVAAEPSGDPDTCAVRYRLDNRDDRPHDIGLRFLLDTFIGGNDGAPFLIPGATRLCDTNLTLQGAEIPQYIQACEFPDLANPGTVARLSLRVGSGLEPPGRVTLGAWPNPELADRDERCKQEKTLWEVPVLPIKSLATPDSAVTLYWDERPLAPGASREVGFAYGLGSVAGSESGGQLAVSVGGALTPGGELTVTAYVHEPSPGQDVTLQLPPGFVVTGGSATQPVPTLPPGATNPNSPVTWRITAPASTGDYDVTVRSSTGVTQSQRLTIQNRAGLFGG